MNADTLNQDSLQIDLKYIQLDSTLEYDLIVNNILIKKFEFNVNQIKTYPRLRIKNEPDSFLFRIFDYKYIPSEKKVYVLIDEWGYIKLYSFYFDPANKNISKIKDNGKPIFYYDIRQMDTDLFQSKSICLKYYDDNLILMVYPPAPSSGKFFIKIPLNEYQQPVQLVPILATKYVSERLSSQDKIAYIDPLNMNSIIPIIRDKVDLSPYSNDEFKYFFNLENTQRNDKDINGKNIFLLDRYFFVRSDKINLMICYRNLQWLFWEYEERNININEPIKPSFF